MQPRDAVHILAVDHPLQRKDPHPIEMQGVWERARKTRGRTSDWDVVVFLAGPPTPQDRSVLSDVGFDLMMESGQHIQPVAVDASCSVEDSSFLKNLHEDGIAA